MSSVEWLQQCLHALLPGLTMQRTLASLPRLLHNLQAPSLLNVDMTYDSQTLQELYSPNRLCPHQRHFVDTDIHG